MADSSRSLKVLVLGDAGVGKTLMIKAYSDSRIQRDGAAGGWSLYNHQITIQGPNAGPATLDLEIWDSEREHEYFDRLRPLAYPHTDVFVVCFDLASRQSHANLVEKWRPELSHFCPGVPWIVVGLKEDLRRDFRAVQELQKTNGTIISTKEGADAAKIVGAYSYLECAAETYSGVSEVFNAAAKAALTPRRVACRCGRSHPHALFGMCHRTCTLA